MSTTPAQVTLTATLSTSGHTYALALSTTAVTISSSVFVIEQIPSSADPTVKTKRFSHISSVSDLTEIPEQGAMTAEDVYFRTNSIELVFDSAEFADSVQQCIRADISTLVHEYNSLQVVSTVTTVIT